MTEKSTKISANKYTNIAGIAYILIIILALIPSNIFDIGSILKGKDAATNLVGHESIFRLGIAIEFAMFLIVMVLSWALYVILKPINENLALLGLIFRFGEAILGCFIILFYLMILMFLGGAEYLNVFEAEQLQALSRFFLTLSGVGYYILLVIMGVGGTIFCYLFYTSRYIPRLLSIWGIITYLTMVIYGFVNITLQNPPSELAYAMAPGALFEIVIGFWLVIKGIKANQ